MDAADEYELDYEAESPPRASQQLPLDESPPVSGEDDDEEPQSDTDPHPQQQEQQSPSEQQGSPESCSPRGSVEESLAVSPRRLRRKRPLRIEKQSATLVATLTRKLAQYKKRNAETQQQLQRLYQNDAIAFLENKAQERQRQIDALQIENRTLLQQQRVLNKQIEELQDAVETMPSTRVTQREELRICREQLRHYKETKKATEDKAARLHQQVVDLTAANKSLTEKVKQLEGELASFTLSPSSSRAASKRSTASLAQEEAEAVIANQENEITRLQHRVDVMKKAATLEHSKRDKQALAAQEELEKARNNLETFHRHTIEKEKVIRGQFLEIKQLKRSLKDSITLLQLNQQLQQSTGGGKMRFASHTHTESTSKLGANALITAQDLAARLGLRLLCNSPSKAYSVRIQGQVPSPRRQDDKLFHHHHQQQRHVPCPPLIGPVGDKKAPRSARSHVQTTVLTPGSRTRSHNHGGDMTLTLSSEPFYEDVDQATFASLAVGVTTANVSGPLRPSAMSPERDGADSTD